MIHQPNQIHYSKIELRLNVLLFDAESMRLIPITIFSVHKYCFTCKKIIDIFPATEDKTIKTLSKQSNVAMYFLSFLPIIFLS